MLLLVLKSGNEVKRRKQKDRALLEPSSFLVEQHGTADCLLISLKRYCNLRALGLLGDRHLSEPRVTQSPTPKK